VPGVAGSRHASFGREYASKPLTGNARLIRRILEGVMAASEEMKIVLQVGTELRVTNQGDVILSNPELELAREEGAADAVLLYRFNPHAGEHTFRLIDPLADRKHVKVHRPND
jgi:hypothetical protein